MLAKQTNFGGLDNVVVGLGKFVAYGGGWWGAGFGELWPSPLDKRPMWRAWEDALRVMTDERPI